MRINRATAIIIAALALSAAIWLWALFGNDPGLRVAFLDVGEGLCTIVTTPSGKTLVMDCGTSSWRDTEAVGDKVAAAYLQSQGVDTIDVAVLSHPHADHISGFARLLGCKPARLVLDIGARHASPHYHAFLEAVKSSGATYRIARRGQTIDLADGVTVQVLNPNPSTTYSDLNERSMVLRVVYRDVAFLLAADSGEEAEHAMLGLGGDLRAQVLQVGHHGSAAGTSPEWLAAVRPQVAVISCGRSNGFGHPSRETVDRLRARGIRVYRTDQQGAVTVTTDGETVRIRSVRQAP